MTTDNRTNGQLSGISGQFTDEQVEAAYQAWITFPHKRGPQNAESAIRAALEAAARAAQGAAPQAVKDVHEPSHDRVYCVRCGGNWPCPTAVALGLTTEQEGENDE